jgi:hypothetical protein
VNKPKLSARKFPNARLSQQASSHRVTYQGCSHNLRLVVNLDSLLTARVSVCRVPLLPLHPPAVVADVEVADVEVADVEVADDKHFHQEAM